MNSEIYFLAEQLGSKLLASRRRVTTAESCTGGGISYALTEVAGSSAWFEAGFVTYSNDIKHSVLGVEQALLSEHGAVSEAVVGAMALGALKAAAADLAVAVSGIAGPDGGTAAKPVGTVCFAFGSPVQMNTQTFQFRGNRQQVREQTVAKALALVLDFCQ